MTEPDPDPDELPPGETRPSWVAVGIGAAVWGGLAVLVLLEDRVLPQGVLPLADWARAVLAGFLASRALWQLAPRLRPDALGVVAGRGLRAAGWGLLAYGLARTLLADAIAVPAGLVLAGVLLYRVHGRFPEDPATWAKPGVALAGLTVAGVGLVLGAPHLEGAVPAPGRFALLLYLAAAVLALTHVAKVVARSDRPHLARAAHLMASSPRRNLTVALGLAGYLLYRPVLAERVRYLSLYEWGLGLAILGLLMDRLAAWYRRDPQAEPWASDRIRHVQRVRLLPDEPARDVAARARAFLEGELDPERYASLWKDLADHLGADGDLRAAVQAVAAHEDEPEPRVLRLPWRVERVREANRDARRRLHERLISNLDPHPG